MALPHGSRSLAHGALQRRGSDRSALQERFNCPSLMQTLGVSQERERDEVPNDNGQNGRVSIVECPTTPA